MAVTNWERLDAVTGRITLLVHQAQTAAAEGDNARAGYFALKVQEATAARQAVLDQISERMR